MELWNQSRGDEYLNGTQFDDHNNATRITLNADSGVLTKMSFSINLLGCLGNLITIWYIICSKQLHTPTFFAICSLAITDFLICTISLIDKFVFERLYILSVLFYILTIAIVKSSCDVVFLFSLRYALIVHPLKCRQYLTNSFVISASLALWGYSFIVFSLMVLTQYLLYESNLMSENGISLITTVIVFFNNHCSASNHYICSSLSETKNTTVLDCQRSNNEKDVLCHHCYCCFEYYLWYFIFFI